MRLTVCWIEFDDVAVRVRMPDSEVLHLASYWDRMPSLAAEVLDGTAFYSNETPNTRWRHPDPEVPDVLVYRYRCKADDTDLGMRHRRCWEVASYQVGAQHAQREYERLRWPHGGLR